MIQDVRNGVTYGYQYDAAGRLATLTVNGVVEAEYRYNALGQQTVRRLTAEQRTIHSVHDTFGNRIAEYEFDALAGTSTLLREYVWLDGRIIAVIEGGAIYHVRTDHIGRPVFATDGAGLKVWEASYLPFGGVHVATTFPGSSTDPLDLRFPGQWFQAESGLHQNWMRDYDPTTGRYIQADPLGLVDGASVYGYALQSPMRWTDPTGEAIPLLAWAAIASFATVAVETYAELCQSEDGLTGREAAMIFGFEALGIAGEGLKLAGRGLRSSGIFSTDAMADIPRGALYDRVSLSTLSDYMYRRGVNVSPTRGYPSFSGRNGGGEMRLSFSPTRMEVLHEMSHWLDYKKHGEAYYRNFSSAQRERMVLTRLQNNRAWNDFSSDERSGAVSYVERLERREGLR